MKSLKVNFNTLDGNYSLIVLDDHTYSIETTIEVFENKNGIIKNYEEFISKLNEAKISSWDDVYQPNGLTIEDSVKWDITLDDKFIKGEEGYWPYGYDKLIEALMSIDNKLDYFKANLS